MLHYQRLVLNNIKYIESMLNSDKCYREKLAREEQQEVWEDHDILDRVGKEAGES